MNLSVTTLRTRLARMLEPRAPRPDLRLHAVQELRHAGISRWGVRHARLARDRTRSRRGSRCAGACCARCRRAMVCRERAVPDAISTRNNFFLFWTQNFRDLPGATANGFRGRAMRRKRIAGRSPPALPRCARNTTLVHARLRQLIPLKAASNSVLGWDSPFLPKNRDIQRMRARRNRRCAFSG